MTEVPSGNTVDVEEVIAVPMWTASDGQQPMKPPMEPIPEDEEESGISPSTSSHLMVQSCQLPESGPKTEGSPTILIESASSNSNGENAATEKKSPPAGADGRRVKESKQRLREVYTTEEVDTLVSTLPKDSVPVEWEHFSSEQVVVDPKMAHTYVTELAGGLPSARGNKYSYSYESQLEDADDEEQQNGHEIRHGVSRASDQNAEIQERRECEEQRQLGHQVMQAEDGLELHSTSTQKITRVTKITTTRSVKQIPVEPGDIYFDADGNPILNGFDAQTMSPSPLAASSSAQAHSSDEADFGGIASSLLDPGVGIDLSRTYLAEHSEEERYFGSDPTTSKQVSPQSMDGTAGKVHYAATPSSPGVPQVTDLTDTTISLAWLRPDFDGTAGPLIGYRVEFRRSALDDDWDPAHDDLLGETECKITNLDPEEPYQFRVLGANMAGFGLPSNACPPIRLREQQQSTQFGTEADLPPPPGRPQIVGVDGDRATIEWRPSLADPAVTSVNGIGATDVHQRQPIIGYLVEFRAAGNSNWLPANERPIKEHRFQVVGLRPNGEYEFRVLAKDVYGHESASPSSGFVRIRPPAPIRQANGFAAIDITTLPEAPSQPKVLESGPNWVHLHWEPPPPASTSSYGSHPAPAPPMAYLLEMRELGESRWIPLADQQLSPVHGSIGNEEDQRVPVTTTMDHFIVENLLPDSAGYEFRLWSVSLLNGLRSERPSANSEPIRLRPLQAGSTGAEWQPPLASASAGRRPPERPSAPEYLDYDGGQSITLCWLPAKSVLPVQGYEVEFRDLMQDAKGWHSMTEGRLVRACKTHIGNLIPGHQLQFRILAKNGVGLSQPSDPSPLITIGPVTIPPTGAILNGHEQPSTMMPLMEEMTLVRESPPLPDRDDSPPPIYRQTESSLQWRDPTLKEVIDYLKSPDQTLVLDASGYLQHLTFNNDLIKEETRNYGGIECLIRLLSSQNPEILRNVCGCLKNLAFGKANDPNKRLIQQKGGLKAMAQLLRTVANPLVHEEATGAIWNISSADELKEAVLNQCAETVIQHAVLPSSDLLNARNSTASTSMAQQQAMNVSRTNGGRNPTANVFRNGTGILRNISAINDQARRFLRSAPGLVDALLQFLEGAVQRGQLDTRSTENVICLLRNLSYRVQEVVDPKYDPNRSRYQIHGEQQQTGTENGHQQQPYSGRSTERSRSAPSGSPKTPLGKKGRLFSRRSKKSEADGHLEVPAATGPQRLWHPSTVRLYLRVLQDSADCEILEASAAAIQNLAGCPFDGSALVRQTVRIEKGLPILVELLRLKEDRVVCAVCCALRNLAMDQVNLDLIGKYALPELLVKIPDQQALELLRQQPTMATMEWPSNGTLGAILGILWEAVRQSSELARAIHETAKGTERLRALAKAYPVYERRICKYATQVLFMMWQHKELHELFRSNGLTEADFYSSGHAKGKLNGRELPPTEKHSPSSVATTLARPFSSQGMERPAHLALASSRMDESAADSSHYGGFSSPAQSAHVTPPVTAAVPKPPRQNLLQFKNGQRQFEPQQQNPMDNLYASVKKGNGNDPGKRRRSIDSWV